MAFCNKCGKKVSEDDESSYGKKIDIKESAIHEIRSVSKREHNPNITSNPVLHVGLKKNIGLIFSALVLVLLLSAGTAAPTCDLGCKSAGANGGVCTSGGVIGPRCYQDVEPAHVKQVNGVNDQIVSWLSGSMGSYGCENGDSCFCYALQNCDGGCMGGKCTVLPAIETAGVPAIVDTSSREFTIGEQQDVRAVIKNVGSGPGNFVASLSCGRSIAPAGSQRFSIEAGAVVGISILVSGGDGSGPETCNLKVYDAAAPDKIVSVPVTVSSLPLVICTVGKESCNGRTREKCVSSGWQGRGSSWQAIETCNENYVCSIDVTRDGISICKLSSSKSNISNNEIAPIPLIIFLVLAIVLILRVEYILRVKYRNTSNFNKQKPSKPEHVLTTKKHEQEAPAPFCDGCGQKILKDDIFCTNCGRKVKREGR